MMIKKNVFISIILIGIGFMIYGCGKSDYPEESCNYVIIPSSPDIYSEQVSLFFKKTIKENGGNAIIKTPEDTSAESQIKILKQMKDEKVDCVIISANASSIYQEELEEMVERGVKVIAFDQVMQKGSGITIQICASRLDKTGEMFLSIVEENIKDDVKQIAMLMPNNFQYNEQEYAKDIRRLLEMGKYPDILLTEINFMDDDNEKCREKVENLINKYPDLDAIFTTSSISTVSAANYLIENNLSSQIKLVGIAVPDEVADYIGEDNVCMGIIYCDPVKMGKLTAYVSMAITEKGFIPEDGSILESSSFGKYEVETLALENNIDIPVIFMQDYPDLM